MSGSDPTPARAAVAALAGDWSTLNANLSRWADRVVAEGKAPEAMRRPAKRTRR